MEDESYGYHDGGYIRPFHIVHQPEHLGPPEVQGRENRKTGPTEHGEVEMRNHKVGVMNIDIGTGGTKEKSGQTPDGEEIDKGKRQEKGRRHLD